MSESGQRSKKYEIFFLGCIILAIFAPICIFVDAVESYVVFLPSVISLVATIIGLITYRKAKHSGRYLGVISLVINILVIGFFILVIIIFTMALQSLGDSIEESINSSAALIQYFKLLL